MKARSLEEELRFASPATLPMSAQPVEILLPSHCRAIGKQAFLFFREFKVLIYSTGLHPQKAVASGKPAPLLQKRGLSGNGNKELSTASQGDLKVKAKLIQKVNWYPGPGQQNEASVQGLFLESLYLHPHYELQRQSVLQRASGSQSRACWDTKSLGLDKRGKSTRKKRKGEREKEGRGRKGKMRGKKGRSRVGGAGQRPP